MSVLALDVGTTGVTALVVSEEGAVLRRGYQEFPQHFPQPGWVEHEPEEIWQAVLAATRGALGGPAAEGVTCVGVTTQRETAVLENLTLEQVQALARKHIDTGRMIVVAVGDAKTQAARLEALGYGAPVMVPPLAAGAR